MDIVYGLNNGISIYDALFVETNQGPRLPTSIVPEQAKFADLARQIETLRTRTRVATMVRMGITAEATVGMVEESFDLLQAMYVTQPPTRLPRGTRIDRQECLGYDTDPDSAFYGDPLVFYRLNPDAHASLKSWLLGPPDVQPEAGEDVVQPEAEAVDVQSEAGDNDV